MQRFLLVFSVAVCFGVIGAILFVRQEFFETEQALAQLSSPTQVTCQTGFDRPMLFGIGPDEGWSAFEGQLKQAGSTLATISLNWDILQPDGPGTLNKGGVDFSIEKASRDGLTVVVNFSGTPNWASGNPSLEPGKAQPKLNDATVEREFRAYINYAVTNNKQRAKYWTYWNEPNGCMSSVSYCGHTAQSMGEFLHWHKIFYDEVKKADPTAKVIIGNFEMVKADTGFMNYVNDSGAKYDYLGLNVYDKQKNANFRLDWAKGAYDRQSNKKPAWINEYGWDRQWWGDNNGELADEDISRKITETFDILTRPENNWIQAASYHNLRDQGGDYGLWEKDNDTIKPRKSGQTFLNIVKTKCNPTSLGGQPPLPPPPTIEGACVASSNNLAGTELKRGQDVTLTALATHPIKTFWFALYNQDNKDANKIPRPYCVEGNKLPGFENDGCPAGTYQYRIAVNGLSSTTNQGAVQSFDMFKTPQNKVMQSMWKGNTGWLRMIDYNSDTTADRSEWKKVLTVDVLKLSSSSKPEDENMAQAYWIDSQGKIFAEVWQKNIAYKNTGVISGDGSSISWNSNTWQATNATSYPGTGQVTASSAVVVGDSLWQTIWRGDTEWKRKAPLRNGSEPDFSQFNNQPNKGFVQTRTLSQLGTSVKGNGSIQAIDHLVLANGSLLEVIWRGDQASQRIVTITNREPNWSSGTYSYPAITSNQPINEAATSITLPFDQLQKIDKQPNAGGKAPKNIQVNATFMTEQDKFIDNHVNCVSSIKVNATIPGDMNGDCEVDIYDYNILIENLDKTNCSYNLSGDCRITSNDIDELRNKFFGTSCNAY